MTNKFDFTNDDLEIFDFVPRKLTADDCRHHNKDIVMRGSRIEYTECFDCGEKVWS